MHAQPAARTTSIAGFARPAGRFAAELLGMCAVMCVGGNLLSIAFFGGSTVLGYSNLARQAPELSTIAIVIALSIPMAIYMVLRGHGRAHSLSMTASTVGVGILVVAGLWFGVIPKSNLDWGELFGLVCGPACLVMVAQMLFSFDMYSGRASHAQRA